MMHKEQEMKDLLVMQSLVTRPAKISRFLGALVLSLMLVGNLPGHLYAETSSDDSAVIASVTVNINTASVNDLAEALVGVGVKKAEAIVEYRNVNGPFTDKNQLLNVKGIGEATLDKNSSVIML